VSLTVDLLTAALLGAVAGLVPVYAGLVPLTFVRGMREDWKALFLSLSIGILLFLMFDVTEEALEKSKDLGNYGHALYVGGFALGLLGLVAYESARNRWRPARANHYGHPVKGGSVPNGATLQLTPALSLAYMIAMGIGLHNMGEGLAVGASYAAGAIGLSFLLVVGFFLHNMTEGIGIVAPLTKAQRGVRVGIGDPLALGFLAGFPTVIGAIIGAWAYSDALAIVFFSIAAGSLLYVITELIPLAYTKEHKHIIFIGILLGMLIMRFTGLLVPT